MTYDTWKLDEPELPPDPDPVPLWHFFSDDYDHEHWALSASDADRLMEEYALRGEPFTVQQMLVPPDEYPPREDDSDAFCDI